MKLLNISKTYDGQNAFFNGMHDAIRLPNEPNLYREGLINKVLWYLGRKVGALSVVGKFCKVK
jgi:hypothetical protein